MSLPKPTPKPVLQQFSLAGKVAIVTGGARGIGYAVSEGLAEAGCTVALTYTTSSEAPAIAAALAQRTGAKVVAYACDVQDAAAVRGMTEKVLAELGRLDIVVANAGVTLQRAALDYTPAEFRRVMDVNLDGAFFTAQAAGRAFQHQLAAAPGFPGGSLIVTSSVSSHLVNLPQKQAAYNASKAGVEQLAKCLAVEWVGFARVNCVCPGFIATDMLDSLPEEYKAKWLDMTPANRFCDPAELKGASPTLSTSPRPRVLTMPIGLCLSRERSLELCHGCINRRRRSIYSTIAYRYHLEISILENILYSSRGTHA